jgi:hypothetical protein
VSTRDFQKSEANGAAPKEAVEEPAAEEAAAEEPAAEAEVES